MSRCGDRLGLLLPIPALLVAEPTSAYAAETPTPPASESAPSTAPPPAPADEPPPPGTEPPPGTAPDRNRAAALFEEGEAAFADGDYTTAAQAFEKASEYADLVPISVDATIAYRYAALEQQDANEAASLCEAARRTAEHVIGHPEATEEHVSTVHAEVAQADEHCTMLADTAYGPCLSPDIGPCLNVIEPRPKGCGSKGDEDFALLPTLMLMGLRTRRRRDAVEQVADTLPADVAERLRRDASDDSED